MALNRLELLLGWSAIVLVGAVVAFAYVTAGSVVEKNVAPDILHGFLIFTGATMLALAIGLTLDGVFDLLPGRVLLVPATLVLAWVTAQLPLFYVGTVFGVSVLLALGATLIALFRPHGVARGA